MKKAKENKILVFVIVFMTALLIVLAVVEVGLLLQKAEVDREKAELIAEIERLYNEKDLREGEAEYMNTLEWAEKKARALGMISADEEIWVLIG